MYDFISLSLAVDKLLALTPNDSETSLFNLALAENLLAKIAI